MDDIFPPLINYGKDLRECGQRFTSPGSRFWGDLHAKFTIGPDGTVEAFEAGYPLVAYENEFVDCASRAFKELRFAKPKGGKSAEILALISVAFAG